MPTNEFAIESISCPLTPKSHSLISPRELTRMLDGFTSTGTHPSQVFLSEVHPTHHRYNHHRCTPITGVSVRGTPYHHRCSCQRYTLLITGTTSTDAHQSQVFPSEVHPTHHRHTPITGVPVRGTRITGAHPAQVHQGQDQRLTLCTHLAVN